MKNFTVTGMSCAACSARVEKAVLSLDGIESCSVSLLTNTLSVSGNVPDEKIIAAVISAGYGAEAQKAKVTDQDSRKKQNDLLFKQETHNLLKRLISSVFFLAALMYISMGHIMWGWYLPSSFAENPVGLGLAQMLLCVAVMLINKKFFVSGALAFFHKAPNMDSLVALGSGASFVYSVCVLFSMTASLSSASHSLHDLYFESSAMILTLITVGKLLESVSKGRTTTALRALLDLSPKTATLLVDGKETVTPIEKVKIQDIFVVKSGERIPVDARITEGFASVDESALSGESLPCDKGVGDRVSAGTVNKSGYIKCVAERVGEDTTLAQIIKLVSDASSTKAPVAKLADKVSGVFVPSVMALSLVSGIVWLIAGESIGFALARAVSVLVISCPCALGLATPVAIMVGSGIGAKNGILFKTAAALENCGRAQIIALDKTGTVTKGEMSVTDIIPSSDFNKEQLISLSASIENKSEHPIGRAIVRFANENDLKTIPVTDFSSVAGKGISAKDVSGREIVGGSFDFVAEGVRDKQPLEEYKKTAERLAESGKTAMFFSFDGKLVGVIAVADTVKEDSAEAIRELQGMGAHVVMLTGDNPKTAHAIGSLVGVNEVKASVLPNGKAAEIKELQKQGKVIMVGDGINDSPALAVADTGIAIGAGTDIAIDSADVVLVKSKLTDLTKAIRLSRATLRNIRENLFWAFIYNVVGIPLAAGVWIPLFNLQLSPTFAALAMSLSSFCVVTNALRLNFINLSKRVKIKKRSEAVVRQEPTKGELTVTKIIRIDGMMCPHCSGRVKKALESIESVELAEVSHEEGTARVTLRADVDSSILKNAVEAQGYNVISID